MRFTMTLVLACAFAGGCATVDRPAPKFHVGDIVTARHFGAYPQFNGTQVRVTGGYQWRFVKGHEAMPCYAITTVDGQELAAQEFQLQKVIATAQTVADAAH
jgi:hypothetical protein